MPQARPQVWRYWVPLCGWALVMLTASSMPGTSIPTIEIVNWDKGAHCLEYAILGAFWVRLWLHIPKMSQHPFAYGLLCTILFGALDEIHQLFIPLRSADILDWAADSCGALIGCSLYWGFIARVKKPV